MERGLHVGDFILLSPQMIHDLIWKLRVEKAGAMAYKRALATSCIAGFLGLLLFWSKSFSAGIAGMPVPIRIGWQLPAATQAQITQVLKRTNVLEIHGLEPSLVPFSYGGPQASAAFKGEFDVMFAGDQPAINLIARGGKWKIVARLFDDRISTIVPPNSPIQTIGDLKGRTVASPFGSVAHREAFFEQRVAGLDTDRDVENINLDILEINRRVLAGGIDSWPGIDAAVVWEPTGSYLELEGLARIVNARQTLGVVAISDDFIEKHPEATVQFLVALTRAWDFFSRNPDRVMQWYIDDTHLDYPTAALVSSRLDRNFKANSLEEINLDLTEDDIAAFEQGAQWARDSGQDKVQIRPSIDLSLLEKAKLDIADEQFENLKVILPSFTATGEIHSDDTESLDSAPLTVVFALMVLIALLAIESGYRLGKRNHNQQDEESVRPMATVVGAILAMMAFVIALTFGSANNRFDARKAALLEDVTSIQATYLQTNLLPEPHRTTIRSLLRDYVQVRVGIVYAYGNPNILQLIQKRADALQVLMWSHVQDLVVSEGDTRISLLFAGSLTDVFEWHTKRVVLGANYRIPSFVWLALTLASGVAMFLVGFQSGFGGGNRVHAANVSLAITFALVMMLAFDLDRASEGFIIVNQQPMLDLHLSMSKR